MATALKLEDTAVASNDIVVAVTQNPGLVLLDRTKFTDFYERMKAETDKLVPDVTTNRGRDEIRSMAARVVRSKTAIEAARLELTKAWRDQVDAANAAGKEIKTQMEALADEVRKPLTEWEEAEKARVASCRAIIDGMKAAAVVTLDDTTAAVRERGTSVYQTAIDADTFGDMLPEAENAKDVAVETLKGALARLTREEADRAELERLRAENEAREAKEVVEREARERAEREAEEERQAVERQAEAARAEQERIATAAREAEERVKREAEEATQAVEAKRSYARQIIEHIKRVGLGMIGGKTYPYGILLHELESKIAIDDSLGDMQDEVRTIRDITLANVKAAMERRAEKDAAAEQAENDRAEAAERAKLAENVAHRTKVKTEAKQALITCGADEETARKIVMAILAGEVPHVRMEF